MRWCLGVRRRRHVVLSLDRLVPLPIVGKQQEVVVGELHAGVHCPHMVSSPDMRPVYGHLQPAACHSRRLADGAESFQIRTGIAESAAGGRST